MCSRSLGCGVRITRCQDPDPFGVVVDGIFSAVERREPAVEEPVDLRMELIDNASQQGIVCRGHGDTVEPVIGVERSAGIVALTASANPQTLLPPVCLRMYLPGRSA